MFQCDFHCFGIADQLDQLLNFFVQFAFQNFDFLLVDGPSVSSSSVFAITAVTGLSSISVLTSSYFPGTFWKFLRPSQVLMILVLLLLVLSSNFCLKKS